MNDALHYAAERAPDPDSPSAFADNGWYYITDRSTGACLASDTVAHLEVWK